MNKRQRKKNEKRHYQRLAKMLEQSHREMVHFWLTYTPQNEQEARLIEYNLRCLREMVRGR